MFFFRLISLWVFQIKTSSKVDIIIIWWVLCWGGSCGCFFLLLCFFFLPLLLFLPHSSQLVLPLLFFLFLHFETTKTVIGKKFVPCSSKEVWALKSARLKERGIISIDRKLEGKTKSLTVLDVICIKDKLSVLWFAVAIEVIVWRTRYMLAFETCRNKKVNRQKPKVV